jgi:maleylpyruvate isomerase
VKLYGYFRSSAAWRVRIALHWKGIAFESVAVNLLEGAHLRPGYLALNPQGVVPTLVDGDLVLGQSLAILEYLEETRPDPPLLPGPPAERARARQLALTVACDVHPLQNLGPRRLLREEFGLGEEQVQRFARLAIERGLRAVEAALRARPAGPFCCGARPTLADVCLVPQLAGARRFGADLGGLERALAAEAACARLEAFARAAPESQPDAA